MTTPMYNEFPEPAAPKREPIFNIPLIIIAALALLAAIHAVRVYWLSDNQNITVIFDYAFIPARYSQEQIAQISPLAQYWSPVTYSFLHADWTHFLLNGFWLLAFGGVVAKRISSIQFIFLYLAGAIGGAALHYLAHVGEISPMIGASASVSAYVGAATRFAFPKGGGFVRDAANLPRQSLVEAFSNRQVLVFVGIWFFINLLVGSGLIDVDGKGSSVAWQAHVGGFLVGLLLFAMFDRKERPQTFKQ